MDRYEYKVVIVRIGILMDRNTTQEKQLNVLGAEGWKLVTVAPMRRYFKYFLIRER